MAQHDFDTLVIGGGPGGYTAAIRSAQLGMKTALLERDRLGGICLNWGCIPTKALLKNAELLQTIRKAEEYGISVDNIRVDFGRVIKRSRDVADKISKGVEFLMKKNAIAWKRGTARLEAPGRVVVQGENSAHELITAAHIILATGARPRTIPGVALDRTRVITSTEAMNLPALPHSMVIIGAGAIGIEFAYFYNALGTKVTVVEMLPTILPIEDREITKELDRSLKKQGMTILTGTKVEKVTPSANTVAVTVSNPEGTQELKAEIALMAIGVRGNVEELGLEESGVAFTGDRITVDAHYRTNVTGIYAIGDVIGPPWLAHVASAEGIHCVEAIAGKEPAPLDYSSIPGCTYCKPQVASLGLTEEKARELGHEIKVGKCPYRPLGKAMATGETEGMVKLIFEAQYGELLGAHILGADATEMIHELVMAKRLEGTGTAIFRSVHAHPTLSEAVMEAAAAAYGEAINI